VPFVAHTDASCAHGPNFFGGTHRCTCARAFPQRAVSDRPQSNYLGGSGRRGQALAHVAPRCQDCRSVAGLLLLVHQPRQAVDRPFRLVHAAEFPDGLLGRFPVPPWRSGHPQREQATHGSGSRSPRFRSLPGPSLGFHLVVVDADVVGLDVEAGYILGGTFVPQPVQSGSDNPPGPGLMITPACVVP